MDTRYAGPRTDQEGIPPRPERSGSSIRATAPLLPRREPTCVEGRLWLDPDASFRRSSAFEARPEATATWLRLAELKAAKVECAPFDRAKFRDAVDEVRRWVERPVTPLLIRQITELLATVGVAFVLVRGVEGSRASGVTRWVTNTKAYIALSLQYKRDNHFWFTLFHEVAHVLLHASARCSWSSTKGKTSDLRTRSLRPRQTASPRTR